MAPEPASARLGQILKALDSIEEQAFAVRGEAMLLVEERNLFRFVLDEEVGDFYMSFDKWLKDTLPRSWGYCRDALRVRKELKDVPYSDLVHMKRCNLEQLKKVSSSVRILPEVVQAAKSMPEKAFVEEMNRRGQHLEVKQPIAMATIPDLEERKAAIEMAMVCEECSTESEAEKAIYVSYIQDHASLYEHKREGAA
jgi:hypothetical protein